jgi:hypothetical protein
MIEVWYSTECKNRLTNGKLGIIILNDRLNSKNYMIIPTGAKMAFEARYSGSCL